MRTVHRAGAGLLTLMLAGALVACGDDDDEETSDTTEATASDGGDESSDTTEAADGGEEAAGSNEEFCSAVVDFNTAVFEVEIDESSPPADITAAGEMLIPLLEPISDNAPDDLVDSVAEVEGFIEPLAEGDAAAFGDDSTFETYNAFIGGAVAACDYEKVEVTGVDYAFEDVPETIPAGTTSFAFTNAAETEEHEMIVFRKADGVTETFEDLLQLGEEESADKLQFVTAAFAPPGEEGSTLAELEAGDYAMVCFIPVGGGEFDGTSRTHLDEGMIQEFTVE